MRVCRLPPDAMTSSCAALSFANAAAARSGPAPSLDTCQNRRDNHVIGCQHRHESIGGHLPEQGL